MLLLQAMTTNGDAHKVGIMVEAWRLEMENNIQKLTNVSNVTLASDDDKRRRSQSWYKAGGMEMENTVQKLTNFNFLKCSNSAI